MALESELLVSFGGHEVLMANGQLELLVGLEVSKPVGRGIGGSTCFGIEIVFEYVGDLADSVMDVGIRISWVEIDQGSIVDGVRGHQDEQACRGLVSSRRDTGSTFRHCRQAFRILSALRALSALHDS